MDGQNVMFEKIQEWKDAHKEEPRELDFDFFYDILNRVNGASAVKVACNPTAVNGDWIPGTLCRNVSKAVLDEQNRLTLYMRHDKTELPADTLFKQVSKLKKKVAGTTDVMLQVSDSKSVRLTDAYSHSIVNDQWAGLPFDLVFAYYDEDKRPETAAKTEEAEAE